MTDGLTMKEYMLKHGIPGDPKDCNVNRMMRAHFTALGLERRRMKNKWVWVGKDAPVKVSYGEIEKRLKEIRNGEV